MPAVPLPDDLNLEQLRKQAKDLRDLARAGEPGALALFAEHHPKGAHPVSLTGAQLVVARHHGFISWARLKRHVELIQHYRRVPDRAVESSDPATEFLRLACLDYGNDSPDRWARARALLAANPGLTRTSVHVAAACADVERVDHHLETDRERANAEDGPHAWPPLMYLAYARHAPDIDQARVLATARILLEHGADPNAGYLWHGLPTPFTALTGVFGNGELGEHDCPAHPHAEALARLLLDAGAEPNDGQVLYNRQFGRDNSHLVLLFEYGLGRGDGGVWRDRLGDAVDSPGQLLRRQLLWAVTHDMEERVRLLAANGVDLSSRWDERWARGGESRNPAGLAAVAGHVEMADLLVRLGADVPDLDGPDRLIAAILSRDTGAVERLRPFLGEARKRRPGLAVWAAGNGLDDAIDLIVELGFDVNALARSDIPHDQPWQTALHVAAGDGNVALVRRLLGHGADPKIRDARFDSTPLGWARHFAQSGTEAVLEPVTPA